MAELCWDCREESVGAAGARQVWGAAGWLCWPRWWHSVTACGHQATPGPFLCAGLLPRLLAGHSPVSRSQPGVTCRQSSDLISAEERGRDLAQQSLERAQPGCSSLTLASGRSPGCVRTRQRCCCRKHLPRRSEPLEASRSNCG